MEPGYTYEYKKKVQDSVPEEVVNNIINQGIAKKSFKDRIARNWSKYVYTFCILIHYIHFVSYLTTLIS